MGRGVTQAGGGGVEQGKRVCEKLEREKEEGQRTFQKRDMATTEEGERLLSPEDYSAGEFSKGSSNTG